jgi:hypothetical protein
MLDASVASSLGRFFAAKFRAGVLYRIFEQTGDRAALDAASTAYRAARDAWSAVVDRTKGAYALDITVGETRVLRGHWADRLAEIDADVAAVTAKLESVKPGPEGGPAARAIAAALDRPKRAAVAARHTPPATCPPGRRLSLELTADKAYQGVRLHYRQINQAERWQSLELQAKARIWRGEIPGDYTGSAYPLQYYFELKEAADSAGLYPGLGPARTQQPYFVVRRG